MLKCSCNPECGRAYKFIYLHRPFPDRDNIVTRELIRPGEVLAPQLLPCSRQFGGRISDSRGDDFAMRRRACTSPVILVQVQALLDHVVAMRSWCSESRLLGAAGRKRLGRNHSCGTCMAGNNLQTRPVSLPRT